MNSTPILGQRPAWLEIDLEAIRQNVAATRRWIGAQARVISVVKANAYGHGLVPTARAALEGGAWALGVAIPDEAVTLREAGISAPILVMGASDPSAAEALVHHGIEAAVSTTNLLEALHCAAVRQGRPARVHVKVDTGMGRVGLSPDECPAFFERVVSAPGLEWAGMMTHFATADEEDGSLAAGQWRKFSDVFSAAMAGRHSGDGGNATPGMAVHAANSAAVCRMPETWRAAPAGCFPAVRAGLLTYGIPPTAAGPMPDIRPALSLRARVTQARTLAAGCTVSYGATFTTSRTSRLAIVPLGYADGYSRACSGRAFCLLRGRRAPVAGRVCMDQFVLDATDTGAEVGDEVVLLGRQGDDEITVGELADWSGSIHHEVLARLGDRLPRIYR